MGMKRKQGRPKLPKGEVKTYRLPLRIKQSDADRLMQLAQESGVKFTEFIRARILA